MCMCMTNCFNKILLLYDKSYTFYKNSIKKGKIDWRILVIGYLIGPVSYLEIF